MLEFLGEEKEKNRHLSAKLHKLCNTVSCVHLVKDQPKWEKILHTLLHIAEPDLKEDVKRAVDQRLIWLFNHSETYNCCHISPRLQVIGKNGTWTKGRPVALQNLYRNNHTMQGLTEQDRRVCRGIKEEYIRTSYKYGKTEYAMDNEIALPALVGHPLLFLESSPDVQVELVPAEPEMQLIKENDRLKLSVFPARTSYEMMVAKDTPTRFKLIRCSDKQNAIIDLLGKELTIPQIRRKTGRSSGGFSVVDYHDSFRPDGKWRYKKQNCSSRLYPSRSYYSSSGGNLPRIPGQTLWNRGFQF